MPSVLIADDAAFMRMMIKNILTDAGYEIVGEAENGAVAVTKYRELKPDLTTMDITMPEMDGLAALKEIRGQDPEARVVMCSALGQRSVVVESFESGARDFIVKPFQPDRVLSAVEKALA
jgi:two-component system chemotaxis response regulator CheY